MKWREPWRESIKEEASLTGSLRRLGRGFLMWSGTFAVLGVFYALVGEISFHVVPERLLMTTPIAAGMAAVLHLIWLLSPREIDSGPRGIFVTKADEMHFIPWQAIASFHLSRTVLPGSLVLKLHSGEAFKIILPYGASPTEISNEITQKLEPQV